MNSGIKKMPLADSVKNEENQTCCCKKLSRKVSDLKETVKNLTKTVENQNETVKNLTKTVENQNEAIMSALAEIKVVITKLVRQETSVTAATTGFPIATAEMFQEIEQNINDDNIVIYANTMNKLWRNNISKNLELILHPNIVMDYNVDGTHGKQRLKDFKKLYGVLIDSIASLPSASNKDPELLLRQAMQLNKKKHFRQQAIQKKSTTPMEL